MQKYVGKYKKIMNINNLNLKKIVPEYLQYSTLNMHTKNTFITYKNKVQFWATLGLF